MISNPKELKISSFTQFYFRGQQELKGVVGSKERRREQGSAEFTITIEVPNIRTLHLLSWGCEYVSLMCAIYFLDCLFFFGRERYDDFNYATKRVEMQEKISVATNSSL